MTLLGLVFGIGAFVLMTLLAASLYLPTYDNGPFHRNDIKFDDMKLIHLVKGFATIIVILAVLGGIVGLCVLLDSVRIA